MSNNNLFMKSGFLRAPLQNGVGRYVCQLQRIVLKFCKTTGASRGLRTVKGKYYASIQEYIPPVPWFYKYRNANKRATSVIIHLRIGHTCSNTFLAKIRVKDSSLCECGLDEGTPDHIFTGAKLEFIEQDLVDFAKQNPGVVVYLKPRRHRGPVAIAEYLNGDRVWMSFHNKTHSEITKWIELLRTQQGDVAGTRLRKLQYTDHPSIQGPWTPFTFKNPELNTASLPDPKFGANDRLPISATEKLRLMFEQQKLNEQ